MPEQVDECVKSVLEDNPDYSESKAHAICNAKNNKGELENVKAAEDIAADEDPCWDGYTMVGTKTDESGNEVPRCVPEEDVPDANMAMAEDSDCPDGKVSINGDCVDVEEVHDVPPSALDMSAGRVLATKRLSGPIEREELSSGAVAYRNVALIDEGVWTDAGSGEPTHYDPQELEIVEDNTLNIAHDAENEVSAVGEIQADSWTVENGTGYADIVLDMDSPASEYADENLQAALESGGDVGFGGPSIEIPAEAYELEQDPESGVPKLVDGEIHGAGLVMDPASKTTAFSHQVAERGVAMSDSQSPMVYTKQDSGMSKQLMDDEMMDELASRLGVPMEELQEAMDGMEMEDDEDEDEEDAEMEEGEDEEEEEEDMDMMDDEAMEILQEQIDDIWGELDEMKAQMDSEMSELASTDTVAELKEAKEDIDKRLSELEDEPKEPQTLADNTEEEDESVWLEAEGPTYDSPNSL